MHSKSQAPCALASNIKHAPHPHFPATEAASHFIAESGISETCYIYDLAEVMELHNTWTAALPRVTPHYAGVCNDIGISCNKPFLAA